MCNAAGLEAFSPETDGKFSLNSENIDRRVCEAISMMKLGG